ncbi:MAG: hypothetical protein VYA34_05680 [Myxococcota bacterium]|nr:hypothetical protein [Myxococcota bacterium]
MKTEAFAVPLGPKLESVIATIQRMGAQPILVGGFVRDWLLNRPSKDYDFEIHGMSLAKLEEILGQFGEVLRVGKAFGVLRVRGFDVDFSLPRKDNKVGAGHRGFEIEVDPFLPFKEAAKRRDLTINSIGLNPITGKLYDPYNGQEDIKARILRPTDPQHFSEDPLRGIRAAQFAARLNMNAHPDLISVCQSLDLSELPSERIWTELEKLFLKGETPSLGYQLLKDTGLFKFFPRLGTVLTSMTEQEWTHWLAKQDRAIKFRPKDPTHAMAWMLWAMILPLQSQESHDSTLSAPLRVEHWGGEALEELLQRLRPPKVVQIKAKLFGYLCEFVGHLSPNNSAVPALRRCTRIAGEHGHTFQQILDARHIQSPNSSETLKGLGQWAQTHQLLHHYEPAIITGQHLMKKGLKPGKHFAHWLDKCLQYQDRTGEKDPEKILGAVLTSND